MAVFQGGDVSLTEDILRQPTEFVRNWIEWVTENRVQIIRDVTEGTSSSVLFTVPKGETLFITTAEISGTMTSTSGINSRHADISITSIGGAVERRIIIVQFDASALASSSNSLSFPMPIMVEENKSVRIDITSTMRASGGFTGFVIPKHIAGKTRF